MKLKIKGTIIADDYKWIYDLFGFDSTCPRDVSRALSDAAGQHVDVYINSGGGQIFAGTEIKDMLQEYGNLKIHVVGFAGSAASVIMCAGKCDISETSMVMIHNVSSAAEGDYHAMDKESEVLQKANKAMCAAYVSKTGKPEAEMLALMDRETWFTAAEAVEMGLADEITQKDMVLVAACGTNIIPEETIKKLTAILKNPQAETQADFLLQAKAKHQYLNLGGLTQ